MISCAVGLRSSASMRCSISRRGRALPSASISGGRQHSAACRGSGDGARRLTLSGGARLVVFRGKGAQYFELSRKLLLGGRRRRLRRCCVECRRQQRSNKLEVVVRLLLAQLPDPAHAMTGEIGLERAHERFPESTVAASAIERAVAVGAIETSGHGLAPWCCGEL